MDPFKFVPSLFWSLEFYCSCLLPQEQHRRTGVGNRLSGFRRGEGQIGFHSLATRPRQVGEQLNPIMFAVTNNTRLSLGSRVTASDFLTERVQSKLNTPNGLSGLACVACRWQTGRRYSCSRTRYLDLRCLALKQLYIHHSLEWLSRSSRGIHPPTCE